MVRLRRRIAVIGFLSVSAMLLVPAFSATAAPPPGAPLRPALPTLDSVSSNSVTISWVDAGDASVTGYAVLRRDRSADAEFQFIASDVTETSYTDDSVLPSTRYAYRVKARNAAGLSRASKSARTETPAAPEQALNSATVKSDDKDTSLRDHQNPPWSGHPVHTIKRNQTHTINSAGGELWYELPSLKADGVYHFLPLTNSINNARFEIYDSSGDIVVQNGHDVVGESFSWTDSEGRTVNRSLRLYFIPETDGDYHLRVYSTQNRTGTIVLRFQDETLSSSGDDSGDDCNSSIFFTDCSIPSEGVGVAGKIHVDDGSASRWEVGLETLRPLRSGAGNTFQSSYAELDTYKVFLRKGSVNDICVSTANSGYFWLGMSLRLVNGVSATSDGGADLCLSFTPDWTGSFYFTVSSRNSVNINTAMPTTPSIGTYTITYNSN